VATGDENVSLVVQARDQTVDSRAVFSISGSFTMQSNCILFAVVVTVTVLLHNGPLLCGFDVFM